MGETDAVDTSRNQHIIAVGGARELQSSEGHVVIFVCVHVDGPLLERVHVHAVQAVVVAHAHQQALAVLNTRAHTYDQHEILCYA